MTTLPKYWYIENKYQEVRNYLVETYGEPSVKSWEYDFIGYTGCISHNGTQGVTHIDYFRNSPTKITFEQFKKYILKQDNMETYKFTPEYCRAHKVGIHVDTPEEVKLCDELLKNDSAHSYLYGTLSYYGNQAISSEDYSHCSVDWYEKNSYEVIKAKDFINFNTKNMEKKLIGYKLTNPEMYKAASMIMYGNSAGSEQLKGVVISESNIAMLKKAGVLDLWFEPVYEEVKPKFEVGDWVLLSDNANGWGSLTEEVNNKVLQITKIDLKDHSHVGGRYYFGKIKTVGKEIVRKATSEEVLESMVKEFTAKTGIEVGSTIVAPDSIGGSIAWDNRKKWRESTASGNRIVKRFSIHPDGKTLLLATDNTSYDVWFDAYKMKLIDSTPNITIKGYKAEFTEDSVSFGCQTYTKEFVLTLAQCLKVNGFEMDIKDEILEIAKYFES